MGISISLSDDVMCNYASLGAEAKAVWHIGPFGFSTFAQVVSPPKARLEVLSVVFSGYLGCDLGGAMLRHQITQHFPLSTYLS